MREIKFRAWHRVKKIMFDVYCVNNAMGGIEVLGPGVYSGWAMVNEKYKDQTNGGM